MSDTDLDLGAGPEAGGNPAQGVDPIEAEAREQGWVPLDQWRHDPAEWSDAASFVERGKKVNPILRKQLEKEKRERAKEKAEMEAVIASLKEDTKAIIEYQNGMEQKIYDRAMKDLKAQQRAAMASGDLETAAEFGEAIDQMKENKPVPRVPVEPKTTTAAAEDPRVSAWIERNQWYNTNAEARADAEGIVAAAVQAAKQSGKAIDVEAILASTESKIKRMYPTEFKAAPTNGFDGGSAAGGPSGSRAKGFSSLPPEGKAQFERLLRNGAYQGMERKKAEEAFYEQVVKYSE